MSSPRVWVYLAYKKTGRISEEKLIEKSANEHLTQTIDIILLKKRAISDKI